MFLRTDNPTELEGYINSAFRNIKTDLIDLHLQEFEETGIRGLSNIHYRTTQYHAAIMLCVLIWLDVDRSYEVKWSDIVAKYKLIPFKENYACIGISLDNLLQSFGLPVVDGDFPIPVLLGIDNMEIEKDFEIEPNPLAPIPQAVQSQVTIPAEPPLTIDIKEELATLSGCSELPCNI